MRIIGVTPQQQIRGTRVMCVNVRDFGAKGDGVTNDAAAVQRAFDAAPDGCSVLFPAGTYHCEWTSDRPNITISKNLSIFLDPGATWRLKTPFSNYLRTSGSVRVAIEGASPAESTLHLYNSHSANSVVVVDLGGARNELRNLRVLFDGSINGVQLGLGGSEVLVSDVKCVKSSSFLRFVLVGNTVSVLRVQIDDSYLELAVPPGSQGLIEDVKAPRLLFNQQWDGGSSSVFYVRRCQATFWQVNCNVNVEDSVIGGSYPDPFTNYNLVVAQYNGIITPYRAAFRNCAMKGEMASGAFQPGANLVRVDSPNTGRITLEFDGCTLAAGGTPTVPVVANAGQLKELRVVNSSPSPWPSWAGQPGDSLLKVVSADRYLGTGPQLATSDVALAGWGTGASVTVSGTDQRGKVVVTAGTSPSANPTVTVTWKTQWPSVPVVLVEQSGGSGTVLQPRYTVSTTQLVITYPGTPTASQTYEFQWIALG